MKPFVGALVAFKEYIHDFSMEAPWVVTRITKDRVYVKRNTQYEETDEGFIPKEMFNLGYWVVDTKSMVKKGFQKDLEDILNEV